MEWIFSPKSLRHLLFPHEPLFTQPACFHLLTFPRIHLKRRLRPFLHRAHRPAARTLRRVRKPQFSPLHPDSDFHFTRVLPGNLQVPRPRRLTAAQRSCLLSIVYNRRSQDKFTSFESEDFAEPPPCCCGSPVEAVEKSPNDYELEGWLLPLDGGNFRKRNDPEWCAHELVQIFVSRRALLMKRRKRGAPWLSGTAAARPFGNGLGKTRASFPSIRAQPRHTAGLRPARRPAGGNAKLAKRERFRTFPNPRMSRFVWP